MKRGREDDEVAAAASASITGYLQNAVRRHSRLPTAEGGRGTRRRLEMVTSSSSTTATSVTPKVEESNDHHHEADDDDDVVFVSSSSSSSFPVAASTSTVSSSSTTNSHTSIGETTDVAMAEEEEEWEEVVIDERPSSSSMQRKTTLPLKKDENAEEEETKASRSLPQQQQQPAVKQEPNSGGVARNADKSERDQKERFSTEEEAKDNDTIVFANVRPTLTSSVGVDTASSYRSQRQRILQEREEAEVEALQRRREKIHRMATGTVCLLAVLNRARRIYRASLDPRLLRSLLRCMFRSRPINLPGSSAAAPAPSVVGERETMSDLSSVAKRSKKRKEADATRGNACPSAAAAAEATTPEERVDRWLPFLAAVAAAKAEWHAFLNHPEFAVKATQAPCWVSLKQDTVKNGTSEAIRRLLTVIAERMEVTPPPSPPVPTVVGSRTTDDDRSGRDDASANPLAPLQMGFLSQLLRSSGLTASSKLVVPHAYYCVATFLALSHAVGMKCRLVVAWDPNHAPAASTTTSPATAAVPPPPPAATAAGPPVVVVEGPPASASPPSLPQSCTWVEVWCPQRRSYLAVNPTPAHVTAWNSPYVFSASGDDLVDVTPRYTNLFSRCLTKRLDSGYANAPRYFWPLQTSWGDTRSLSDVVLATFRSKQGPPSQWTTGCRLREDAQLDRLTYAEKMPMTLTAIKTNPLFVTEAAIGRWEGIYPKDHSTIVGVVRGTTVYKRKAVASLRSRDGWLREGRMVAAAQEDQPYKVVKPPASRPFGAPSQFYGEWQTVPFAPSPLKDDGGVPRHGKTQWYLLLNDCAAPHGLVHLVLPSIIPVVRRMKIDFGLAVVRFVRVPSGVANRRGKWQAIIEGVVVAAVKEEDVRRAHGQWITIQAEIAAQRKRQRAMAWWSQLIKGRLAMARLELMLRRGGNRTR